MAASVRTPVLPEATPEGVLSAPGLNRSLGGSGEGRREVVKG